MGLGLKLLLIGAYLLRIRGGAALVAISPDDNQPTFLANSTSVPPRAGRNWMSFAFEA